MSDLAAHVDLILTSLQFTRDKFAAYQYPTYEFKQQRLADVDDAIAAVRSLRKQHKSKGAT